jgi:hypothetical protein
MSIDDRTKRILEFIETNAKSLLHDFFTEQSDNSVLPNPQIVSNPIKSINDIYLHLIVIVKYLNDDTIQKALIECQRTQSTECGFTMMILGNFFSQIKHGNILKPFETEIPNATSEPGDINNINEIRVLMLEDIATMEQIYNKIVDESKKPAPGAPGAPGAPAPGAPGAPAPGAPAPGAPAPGAPAPDTNPGFLSGLFGKKTAAGKRRSKKQKSRKVRKQRRTRK